MATVYELRREIATLRYYMMNDNESTADAAMERGEFIAPMLIEVCDHEWSLWYPEGDKVGGVVLTVCTRCGEKQTPADIVPDEDSQVEMGSEPWSHTYASADLGRAASEQELGNRTLRPDAGSTLEIKPTTGDSHGEEENEEEGRPE